MRKRAIIPMILLFAIASTAMGQKMTVKDSDANVLMEVNDEGTMGSITLPDTNAALGSETNKLYNLNGTLIWNGSALGTAGSAGGWTDGGTSVYLSTSGDKVGIGTSSPDEKLQVEGRIFNKGNTANDGITIGNSQSNDESAHLTWQNNEGLSIHSWGRNFGDQLFVDGNSSNIGIGDSSPTHTLDVAGKVGINDTQILYLPDQTDFTGTLYLGDGGESLSHDFTSAGRYNTAVGIVALYSNTTGHSNTANGWATLYSNIEGDYNTAGGHQALYYNTGGGNTASGYQALFYNNEGYSNAATGYRALYANTTGYSNTASGNLALSSNTTGYYNTAIGDRADVSTGNLTNATAIGYNASVNDSNKVVIGNSSVTTIGGYANWTNFSDRRLKENIEYRDDIGLDFIMKLNTVSFNYKDDENKRRRDGLIAQDVEEALRELNIDFNGLMIDGDEQQTMNLSYGMFVLPLINAVKEQQELIDDLRDRIKSLETHSQVEGGY